MNVLITGVYGFLGLNLANTLAMQDGFTVFGLYRNTRKEGLDHRVNVVGDFREIKFPIDCIIMCHAAVSSGTFQALETDLKAQNIDFTKSISEAFPQAKIIYISTASVLENDGSVLQELSPVHPISEYAKSKFAGEKIISERENHVIIRLSSLYGNGMKDGTLISNYGQHALQTKKITVWGDGSRQQNYIHVQDIIALIIKAITNSKKISFPLLGVSNKSYSNLEIATIIANFTNSEIIFENTDNSISTNFENEMTKKMVNWNPTINIEKGLEEYIRWNKERF